MAERLYECHVCSRLLPKYELRTERIKVLSAESGGGWRVGKSSWTSNSTFGKSSSRKGGGGRITFLSGRKYYRYQDRYTCQKCYDRQPHGLWEHLFGKPKKVTKPHNLPEETADAISIALAHAVTNSISTSIVKSFKHSNQKDKTARYLPTETENYPASAIGSAPIGMVDEAPHGNATERFIANVTNAKNFPESRMISYPLLVGTGSINASTSPGKRSLLKRLPLLLFIPICILAGAATAFLVLILTALGCVIFDIATETALPYVLTFLLISFLGPVFALTRIRRTERS